MQTPMTVGHFLNRAELVYPDRVALHDEPDQPAASWGSMTFAQVAVKARAQAAGLDKLGVGAGERVAIVSQNSARLMLSLMAVPAYGRVCVPVNFRLSREEVTYIVEHSGASVLMIDPELEDTLGDIPCKHKFIIGAESDKELYLEGVEPVPWEIEDENTTATINYTSGTTARPKGVELTHRNIWMNAVTFGWHVAVESRDVYLHTLPMFHCNGWGMPYATTAMGVPSVVLRKVDGTEILNRIKKHGVTLMCGAPAVVAATLDALKDWEGEVPGHGTVRMVIAGAPPPSSMITRMEKELGWEFIQIYGLTETAPLLTINRAPQEWDELPDEERAQRLVRAGAPALGIELKVSTSGEILAKGNHILKSYWDQPDATAQALEGGWFHTGDGGVIDEANHVTIQDRKKDVIISGGENISSIEVEDALFSHPAVAETAVIGVPHEKWGESPLGLVVLAEGKQATEQELIDHCREKIAHYKCPTAIEFREALDRTATGKIQKYKLRTPYWEGMEKLVN